MRDLNIYISNLTSEHASLATELSAIAIFDPITKDWVAKPPQDEPTESDENLQADQAEEWQLHRALLTQLEMRFNNLERALQKTKSGGYGDCEICQEHIEIERLAVNPAARTCKLHLERERELPA